MSDFHIIHYILCCLNPTVTFIKDVPQQSTVIFLNKWTHLLTSLATVTTRLPNSEHFICMSIRELPGKPPTDAHSAAGYIIVNTVDSYSIPEELCPKLLPWMTIPMCILKRCDGSTLLQCLTEGSSANTKVVISMIYAMPGESTLAVTLLGSVQGKYIPILEYLLENYYLVPGLVQLACDMVDVNFI